MRVADSYQFICTLFRGIRREIVGDTDVLKSTLLRVNSHISSQRSHIPNDPTVRAFARDSSELGTGPQERKMRIYPINGVFRTD